MNLINNFQFAMMPNVKPIGSAHVDLYKLHYKSLEDEEEITLNIDYSMACSIRDYILFVVRADRTY
jgi:hypothetical protein